MCPCCDQVLYCKIQKSQPGVSTSYRWDIGLNNINRNILIVLFQTQGRLIYYHLLGNGNEDELQGEFRGHHAI
ncbi:hypothetical protein PIROE2DRAFT_14791 [Piromyces sp. E2]|nr:hypothetical protein PIROE2DRAFT_14791 [Piromyces sp. E2]|eukprot:OUM59620.1 hypothetical protein PIROE2DRAFT_14791 [Piromyces sp. E2]